MSSDTVRATLPNERTDWAQVWFMFRTLGTFSANSVERKHKTVIDDTPSSWWFCGMDTELYIPHQRENIFASDLAK